VVRLIEKELISGLFGQKGSQIGKFFLARIEINGAFYKAETNLTEGGILFEIDENKKYVGYKFI
jgi:hypothetical protein